MYDKIIGNMSPDDVCVKLFKFELFKILLYLVHLDCVYVELLVSVLVWSVTHIELMCCIFMFPELLILWLLKNQKIGIISTYETP
jgi:hypothetical protein